MRDTDYYINFLTNATNFQITIKSKIIIYITIIQYYFLLLFVDTESNFCAEQNHENSDPHHPCEFLIINEVVNLSK